MSAVLPAKRFLLLIGQRIASLRKSRGMTQQELAYRCEMERSAIGRIERGTENITAITILKLSQAFKVAPKEILDVD